MILLLALIARDPSSTFNRDERGATSCSQSGECVRRAVEQRLHDLGGHLSGVDGLPDVEDRHPTRGSCGRCFGCRLVLADLLVLPRDADGDHDPDRDEPDVDEREAADAHADLVDADPYQ